MTGRRDRSMTSELVTSRHDKGPVFITPLTGRGAGGDDQRAVGEHHGDPTRSPLLDKTISAAHWILGRSGAPVWVGLVALCGGLFLMRGRAEAERIMIPLRGADPLWLTSSLLLEVGALVLIVGKYRLLLGLLELHVGSLPLVRAHLRRHVVGAVLPVGGPPSMVVFARDLARHDVSADDALYVAVLYSVIGHISFALFLFPVLAWLVVARQASASLILGAALLAVLLGLIMVPLVRLRRPAILGVRTRRAPKRVCAFIARAREHDVRARHLLTPLALAFGVHIANAAMLGCALRAIGQRPSPAAVLVGYAAGTLFGLLTPLFQGSGVVELTMAGALHRAGVPLAAAVAGTLLYRLAQFWLPLACGVVVQLTGIRRRPCTDASLPQVSVHAPEPSRVVRVSPLRS
jgi:phosphatidylglycerol lysyltransferase